MNLVLSAQQTPGSQGHKLCKVLSSFCCARNFVKFVLDADLARRGLYIYMCISMSYREFSVLTLWPLFIYNIFLNIMAIFGGSI